MTPPVRIFIVEDHPIFRMGMTELINRETDMTVCGDADNVPDAREGIADQKPDLVVVDLSLKQSNGMDLVREICEEYEDTACLVLTMHDESLHADRCIKAGARGYIMKEEASKSVISAIREIMAGNLYVSRSVMSRMLDRLHKKPDPAELSPISSLTDREMEIFQYIGEGCATGEIAKQLNISVKTIGTYRERIKEKLGIRQNGKLVRHAVIWVETGRTAAG